LKEITPIIKENIRHLQPYEVMDYPCHIKLDANESPYPPFPLRYPLSRIKETIRRLNLYPDPYARELRGIVSRLFKVGVDNVIHGNGSDELICYLIMTFGGPVLYPLPTFSMYGLIAQALDEERVEVALNKEFDIELDRTIDAIERHKPRLLFFSSPNNPTGNCFSRDRLLKIIEHVSDTSIVVVDEAYQPFSGRESIIPLTKRYKNLVVLRTLSKIGLAGLRVGFVIGDKEIIRGINRVRLPFNLNSLSQAMAISALMDEEVIQSNIKKVISERERLFSEMLKIRGVYPYPSEANFILFKVERPDVVFNGLIKKGILIRDMKGSVDGCLRVTVGRPKDNRLFIKTLRGLLAHGLSDGQIHDEPLSPKNDERI